MMELSPSKRPDEIGNTSVRLLIPSRRKDGGIISRELRAEWEDKARAQLEIDPFKGSTPTPVVGSYVHDDGRVTREEITVLTHSCSVATLDNLEAKMRLFGFAQELCRALAQESIFVGWGDMAHLVSADIDLSATPVIEFGKLSPDSQVKHLTLGWGGINGPGKVLQVLSLDTWTLPAADDPMQPEAAAGLTVRAVLRCGKSTRRAWSWVGNLDELKKARSTWKTTGPQVGDLIFFQTRTEYLDMVLVAQGKLVGPRDLRLSHTQLNPVTRQLLLRILRRQWDLLERDLRQKPLDRAFFPKLRQLREGVELTLNPAAAKKTSKKEKTKTKTSDAFRTSVLFVGRMMFLRFLAQKGWLPGGVERFSEAFAKHKDKYFQDYLLPLWFDVLNTPKDQRTAKVAQQFPGDYPYLDGGLFQPRSGERVLRLPGSLFDPEVEGSFLWLFNQFEFSLNEHAGSDDSLRIDPSIFGRALETFNPDDEKKREGVHYTPKPIAWSLALEAILARVERLTAIPREKLEGLLQGRREIGGAEADKVSHVLEELRIVDPAVGSGVLLWAALEVMLELDSACDAVVGGGDGYHRGSRKWGSRSRHFVCNCLHGVDISEEAVELTRLRLWLAVALSEDTPRLLPDLEVNICRGDSLLSASGVGGQAPPGEKQTSRRAKQLPLGLDERERIENDLERLAMDWGHAGEKDPVKQREIRGRIIELRRKLAMLDDKAEGDNIPLDWRTFFPHVFRDKAKGGFDIVIANPPYVRIQQTKEIYRSAWSTLQHKNADLSFAFVELALRELAAPDGGQVAYIQPNFRHHDAADRLRELVVGKDPTCHARLRLWVDFDDAQVFPTATNYVALLFAERTKVAPDLKEFIYSNPEEGSWEEQEDLAWLRPAGRTHPHPGAGDWLTIPKKLRERVLAAQKRTTRRLGVLAEIGVGVQTSKDEVYLFHTLKNVDKQRVEVCRTAGKGKGRKAIVERGIIRECLKGSKEGMMFILFPYDSRGRLLDASAMEKRFPLAWKYLQNNRKALEDREDGKFKDDEWYRFGRSQGFADCNRAKVLVPALLKVPKTEIDEAGKMVFTASGKGGGGAWALVPTQESGLSLEELAALLQTEAAWDHVLAYGSPQQGGWRGVDREVLASIPV